MSWNKFNVNMSFPCKDCADRYLACQDYCERYLDARRKYDERKAVNDADLGIRTYIAQATRENRDKTVKRKRESWRRHRNR